MAQRIGAAWLPSAVLLLWVPGCLALSGPSTVTGTVGGSLSVQCHYEEESKTLNKYWCRKRLLVPCTKIVETEKSEREVRSGRVSIRDRPANLTFTVTVRDLTMEDEGEYWCGMDTPWFTGTGAFLPDPVVLIKVTVSPATSANPETATSIPLTKASTTTTGSPAVVSTTLATTEASPSASNQEQLPESHGTSSPGLPVLLSLLALLLLLLLVGTSLLAWRMVKRQRKAGENSELPWNPTQAPEQSELCYANLELQKWPSLGELVQPRGEEVEYSTVAATQDNLHYSLLAFDLQGQDPKANGSPSRRPQEETEYSVIKKT
ncbi:CMRF35-like molecule 8 [Choloepus didactylus]|uniref:CMRF35-like molecule 8 n=1 Tax=Choloepus didactylus TaxID=27675 RepID=UPI0018A10031|nr:CMRF35-like molecule 8 [Choloepus didactylus]